MPEKKRSVLVLTQKMNREDPILGFFHGWMIELAKHADEVTIICLEKGFCRLPGNVRVLSLGKERGVRRAGFIKNFIKAIWQDRKNYQSVFVHMNPEYVLLGGLLWRLSGKRVLLLYNHAAGG